MNYFAQFQTEYPVEYDNIDKDDALTSAHRETFKGALSTCDDTESMEQCADKFFQANKQLGPSVVFPRDEELLGRIYSYTAFVRQLMRQASLSETDALNLLASMKALTKEERLDEIKSTFGSVLMSAYLIWAFRNTQNPGNPFDGHRLADLPCGMGLDTSSVGAEERYVAWGISVPDDALVTSPTAFDPGLQYLARWKPGGLTQPGKECSGTYTEGLPEVVVEPVPFERVANDFLEFARI
jgi:hypothetical protein